MLAPSSEPPHARRGQLHHLRATPHVDAVDLAQERQRLAGAEFAGARHERADVLRQAAAAESEAGVEESPSDARVVAERVGEHRDVGVRRLAHLGDRVDERDLGGQKGVRRHLDELGGLQVGAQERHARVEQRGVELSDRGLGAQRIRLHPKHDAVGVQGVLDGEALAEELRVPRDFDVDPDRRQRRCARGQFGRRADRDRRLADDHRGRAQPRDQRVDHGVHVAQIGAVFALLLRGSHAEEVHVGELGGHVVVGGETQAGRQTRLSRNTFRRPGS